MDQVLSKDTLPALRDRLWWSLLWLLLGSCALGLLSLLYAVGPYGLPVFLSYLRHPWIVFLNLAPGVLLSFLFLCLYGRPWPAFLTASVIVMGFSFGDYYMLKLRDDPLMFQDLLSLKEGLAVSAREHYDLWPDKKQLLGILCVTAWVLFLKFLAVAACAGASGGGWPWPSRRWRFWQASSSSARTRPSTPSKPSTTTP